MSLSEFFPTEVPKSEYYLSLVRGWEDPNPAPVLEVHEGIMVVRDDLLPAGAKSRFLDCLISYTPKVNEWVYGSSPRWGYGQISLAYVAAKYGRKSTIFIAKSNELHRNSKKAQDFGAKIIQVGTGFMKVCEARAREYVAEDPVNRRLAPFGLADDSVYGSIIKVSRSLPYSPDEVWTVAGSGVLNRGLQMAWPEAKCFMVSVGHKLTEDEVGRAQVIRHPLKFEQQCKKVLRPPFPSVPEYDAKAWEYVKFSVSPNKKILFWNVGA